MSSSLEWQQTAGEGAAQAEIRGGEHHHRAAALGGEALAGQRRADVEWPTGRAAVGRTIQSYYHG